MEDIRNLVKSVLDKGYLMSLATVDENGPWVADIVYVFDDNFKIYWLSQESTRHSKAIQKNPKVAASITVSNNQGEQNIGLQIQGLAEKVEGDTLEMATKHRLKRGKLAPKKEGEILDKGESWYLLKPKRIELIYESKFGFDKKSLEFENS